MVERCRWNRNRYHVAKMKRPWIKICTVKQWDAFYMQLLEAALTSHTLLVFLAALLEIPQYTTGKRSNTYCDTSKEPYTLVSHLSTRTFYWTVCIPRC